jgi:hypothetical protein
VKQSQNDGSFSGYAKCNCQSCVRYDEFKISNRHLGLSVAYGYGRCPNKRYIIKSLRPVL